MEDILIPIAVCVVLPVMIVWLVTRSKNQIVNRKMDVLIKAIENGQDIDPELLSDAAGHDAKKRSVKMRLLRQLCWGVILVIAGAGIGILSARIGYWLLPLNRKIFRLNPKDKAHVIAAPYYTRGQGGIAMTITF